MNTVQHFDCAPGFVVRVAGLPVQLLSELRLERTKQATHEIMQVEQWLQREGEAISEALHPVIGTLSEPQMKPLRNQLLALRRSIFQGKIPKAQEYRAEVLAALPETLVETIRGWYQARERLQRLIAECQVVWEDEVGETRQALQRLAQTEAFLQGLILGSKDLYQDLLKWSREGGKVDAHEERKIEQSTISYLTRMVMKTSPYSTFTSFAAGQWTAEPLQEAVRAQIAFDKRSSVIELNHYLVRAMARQLAKDRRIRTFLPLRVPATLLETENHICLLHWNPKEREKIVHFETTTAIQKILHFLRQRPTTTYGELCSMLQKHDTRHRPEELQHFVDQLIAKGLLQLDFPISEISADYLGELIQFLEGLPLEEPVPSFDRFTFLHTALADYGKTREATTRFALLGRIQDMLKEIKEELQLDVGIPEKNFLFENTLMDRAEINCDRGAWQEVVEDLSLVQQFIALYNPYILNKLAFMLFFREHYDPTARVPLLTFFEALHKNDEEVGEGTEGKVPLSASIKNPYVFPELSCAESQHIFALLEEVKQWLAQLPVSPAGEKQIPKEEMLALLQKFPAFIQQPFSFIYYSQMWVHDNEPALVLNVVQSGFYRTARRFLYYAEKAAIEHSIVEEDDMWAGKQPVPVSVQGVFESNINYRRDALPYEIVYPGTISQQAEEKQLPLSDLSVYYDPDMQQLKLFSEKLQCDVLPVHQGLMHSLYMPPLCRFLLWNFGEAMIDTIKVGPLFAPRDHELLTENSEISFFPRLSFGRIYLKRAYWFIPGREVPEQEKGETAFDYFLKVQRWREKHQLPERCFLLIKSFEEVGKFHKPLYIDFYNYFSLRLFERTVSKNAACVLEEILPAPEDQVLTDATQAYVSEYVFELNRKRGERNDG